MISIDTIYQRVQALANKEQRGYLTPQEFNLFANQAQNEIIEQYFYDVNQFDRSNANSTEYSDMVSLLDKKMAVLKAKLTLAINNSGYAYIPTLVHTIGTVCAVPPRSTSVYNNNDTVYAAEYDRVDYNEFKKMLASPLTRPTANTPVYYILNNSIYPYPVVGDIEITYIRKPEKVSWGYVVVNKKAIYDGGTNTVDFKLHVLEESELVYKILTLAGITLNKPGLSETAVNLERVKTQQEKS